MSLIAAKTITSIINTGDKKQFEFLVGKLSGEWSVKDLVKSDDNYGSDPFIAILGNILIDKKDSFWLGELRQMLTKNGVPDVKAWSEGLRMIFAEGKSNFNEDVYKLWMQSAPQNYFESKDIDRVINQALRCGLWDKINDLLYKNHSIMNRKYVSQNNNSKYYAVSVELPGHIENWKSLEILQGHGFDINKTKIMGMEFEKWLEVRGDGFGSAEERRELKGKVFEIGLKSNPNIDRQGILWKDVIAAKSWVDIKNAIGRHDEYMNFVGKDGENIAHHVLLNANYYGEKLIVKKGMKKLFLEKNSFGEGLLHFCKLKSEMYGVKFSEEEMKVIVPQSINEWREWYKVFWKMQVRLEKRIGFILDERETERDSGLIPRGSIYAKESHNDFVKFTETKDGLEWMLNGIGMEFLKSKHDNVVSKNEMNNFLIKYKKGLQSYSFQNQETKNNQLLWNVFGAFFLTQEVCDIKERQNNGWSVYGSDLNGTLYDLNKANMAIGLNLKDGASWQTVRSACESSELFKGLVEDGKVVWCNMVAKIEVDLLKGGLSVKVNHANKKTL